MKADRIAADEAEIAAAKVAKARGKGKERETAVEAGPSGSGGVRRSSKQVSVDIPRVVSGTTVGKKPETDLGVVAGQGAL
jgi:hypothetical protein